MWKCEYVGMFQIAKNTTPMYRAPEMLDLYQNFPIDEQGDIWVSCLSLYIKTSMHSI